MPRERESFGVQAAKFSLYAPVMAFVLGIFLVSQPNDSTAAVKTMANVKVAIGALNGVLIVGGLLLGVVALISMSKFGTKGILVRSLIGVSVNGLLLGLVVVTLVPAMMIARSRAQLVGHWHGPVGNAQAADITLAGDGAFTFNSAAGTAPPAVSIAGQWGLARNGLIGLTIDRVDAGNPKAVGQKIGLGTVRSATASELVLATDHGDERYTRQ